MELDAAISDVEQPPMLFELPRGFLDVGSLYAVRGRLYLAEGFVNHGLDVASGPSLYMLGLLLSQLRILSRALLDAFGKRLHEAIGLVLLDHTFP